MLFPEELRTLEDLLSRRPVSVVRVVLRWEEFVLLRDVSALLREVLVVREVLVSRGVLRRVDVDSFLAGSRLVPGRMFTEPKSERRFVI